MKWIKYFVLTLYMDMMYIKRMRLVKAISAQSQECPKRLGHSGKKDVITFTSRGFQHVKYYYIHIINSRMDKHVLQ